MKKRSIARAGMLVLMSIVITLAAGCGDKADGSADAPAATTTTTAATTTNAAEPAGTIAMTATTTAADGETTTTADSVTTAAPDVPTVTGSPEYDSLLGQWSFVCGETEAETLGTDYMDMTVTIYDDRTADIVETIHRGEDDDDVTVQRRLRTALTDMALYDGCPNEDWSVQIFPNDSYTEYYISVMPDDTMQMVQMTYYEGETTPFLFIAKFERLSI